jgi:uncharacterized membrane protein
MKTGYCSISHQELPLEQIVQGNAIRQGIFELIKAEHPDFTLKSNIALDELIKYRKKYLETILKEEKGELSHLEEAVLHSINKDEVLSFNIEPELEKDLSIGKRLADRIAEFGGSWTFIICFFSFIVVWMGINIFLLTQKPFDPYPFILLNLILSCLAAIQAPIIMMSQNRKEAKDRQRSEHDYKINLKAELEIRLLHEKIDHLLLQQNQRLMEVQQMQIDLLEDILSSVNNNTKTKETEIKK